MERKKQIYESPDMTEIRVQLESSICSGSVDFNDKDKGITVSSQNVADMGGTNDWSTDPWETTVTTPAQ